MRRVLLLMTVFFVPTAVFAAPITFDLRAPAIEAIDEVNSFTLTQGEWPRP